MLCMPKRLISFARLIDLIEPEHLMSGRLFRVRIDFDRFEIFKPLGLISS
jgi:hypothetical protein